MAQSLFNQLGIIGKITIVILIICVCIQLFTRLVYGSYISFLNYFDAFLILIILIFYFTSRNKIF